MSVVPEEGILLWRGLLRKVRFLVFDFDGTLVDSNEIKWRAFDRCFNSFPAHREEIRAYCRGNSHTPRWEKFRHVYERILRLPYTPEVERELHRCFERETTEQIARAPALPGVEEFLDRIRSRYRTALLSSTPHETLLEILGKRYWSDRFDEVRGAPVHKALWLKELRDLGFPPDQVLLFGDTLEDAEAAREAGCGFVPVPQMQDFRRLL